MKVICIDTKDLGKGACPELKEGKIYTASQCSYFPANYDLLEMPIDPATGALTSYKKVRFIPLSSIDEKEFVRNYNTQTA